MPTRKRMTALVWGGACLSVIGCHRRVVVPTLPPIVQTREVQPPAPKPPAMKSPPPDSVTHAPPVKVTVAKPVKRPHRSSPKVTAQAAAPPPVEIAPTAPPAAGPPSVLGSLTTGGEVTPRAQQETADLIATSERRLQAVAGTKARDQQTQLKEVRHFLDQAKEVMASGDEEGARTLATKAKLLLDDLEKWAQR